MPISKAEFFQAKTNWIQGKVELIDQKLKEQMENPFSCGDKIDIIVSDDGFSDELKSALREQYKAVGWSEVVFLSSAENGERPGLMRITLWY